MVFREACYHRVWRKHTGIRSCCFLFQPTSSSVRCFEFVSAQWTHHLLCEILYALTSLRSLQTAHTLLKPPLSSRSPLCPFCSRPVTLSALTPLPSLHSPHLPLCTHPITFSAFSISPFILGPCSSPCPPRRRLVPPCCCAPCVCSTMLSALAQLHGSQWICLVILWAVQCVRACRHERTSPSKQVGAKARGAGVLYFFDQKFVTRRARPPWPRVRTSCRGAASVTNKCP
jgi:hypothetical protein